MQCFCCQQKAQGHSKYVLYGFVGITYCFGSLVVCLGCLLPFTFENTLIVRTARLTLWKIGLVWDVMKVMVIRNIWLQVFTNESFFYLQDLDGWLPGVLILDEWSYYGEAGRTVGLPLVNTTAGSPSRRYRISQSVAYSTRAALPAPWAAFSSACKVANIWVQQRLLMFTSKQLAGGSCCRLLALEPFLCDFTVSRDKIFNIIFKSSKSSFQCWTPILFPSSKEKWKV